MFESDRSNIPSGACVRLAGARAGRLETDAGAKREPDFQRADQARWRQRGDRIKPASARRDEARETVSVESPAALVECTEGADLNRARIRERDGVPGLTTVGGVLNRAPIVCHNSLVNRFVEIEPLPNHQICVFPCARIELDGRDSEFASRALSVVVQKVDSPTTGGAATIRWAIRRCPICPLVVRPSRICLAVRWIVGPRRQLACDARGGCECRIACWRDSAGRAATPCPSSTCRGRTSTDAARPGLTCVPRIPGGASSGPSAATACSTRGTDASASASASDTPDRAASARASGCASATDAAAGASDASAAPCSTHSPGATDPSCRANAARTRTRIFPISVPIPAEVKRAACRPTRCQRKKRPVPARHDSALTSSGITTHAISNTWVEVAA